MVDLVDGSDGKPWEIAWGELHSEGARQHGRTDEIAGEIAWGEVRWERRGSDDLVDGWEAVGNDSEWET